MFGDQKPTSAPLDRLTHTPKMTNDITCWNCSSTMGPTTKFCTYCCAELVCCGKMRSGGKNVYCYNCGRALGRIKFENIAPIVIWAIILALAFFLLGAPGSELPPNIKQTCLNYGCTVLFVLGLILAWYGYKVIQNQPVRPRKTQLKPAADPYEQRLVTVENHLEDLMDICKDADNYNH